MNGIILITYMEYLLTFIYGLIALLHLVKILNKTIKNRQFIYLKENKTISSKIIIAVEISQFILFSTISILSFLYVNSIQLEVLLMLLLLNMQILLLIQNKLNKLDGK